MKDKLIKTSLFIGLWLCASISGSAFAVGCTGMGEPGSAYIDIKNNSQQSLYLSGTVISKGHDVKLTNFAGNCGKNMKCIPPYGVTGTIRVCALGDESSLGVQGQIIFLTAEEQIVPLLFKTVLNQSGYQPTLNLDKSYATIGSGIGTSTGLFCNKQEDTVYQNAYFYCTYSGN